MDIDPRKEMSKMTLREAQELVQNNTEHFMVCSMDLKKAYAVQHIVHAVMDGWQLIRITDLTEGLEDIARQGLMIKDDNKADGWMAALEQVAALIKDCIKEGVNNDD